jgi:hypothetical protein
MSMFLHRSGIMMKGADPLTALSFVNSVTSTSTAGSLTAMSGILLGDVLVWHQNSRTNAGPAPTAVIPTGFTQIADVAGTISRGIWAYKSALGTESSTSIAGMNGADADRQMLLQFRGNGAISSLTPAGLASEVTNGNPVGISVTASAGAVPLIVFGSYGSSANVTVRDFTPAADAELPAAPQTAFIKYKIYNSAPADTAIDMPDNGNDNMIIGFYLQAA